MSFYPEKKPHISPSAFASWYESRSGFIRSYFQGIKMPNTAAMLSGKKIHGLVEAGLLEVKKRYENAELTLEVIVHDNGTKVLGVPDGFELQGEEAVFVDYKSGKENSWSHAKLAGDLKMKLTAWLVWYETGKPKQVRGFIEYIPTVWNPETREIELTGEESIVAGECIYTYQELESFSGIILKTIEDVNAGYEQFLESTDEFISQDDVAEYADLAETIAKAQIRQEELIERIGEQMSFGRKESYQSTFGTFFFKTTKKYAYPDDLTVHVAEDYFMPLSDAEEVTEAASAAKKKWETENEPESSNRKLQFRAKGKKSL